MYDKQVRRRRAVLALLVGLSLILLTAYFGESPSSPLHGVQRGVLTIVSPIQEGASRALKPVRDLFGWFGDTLDAKQERDGLKQERDRLRKEVIGAEQARQENDQLRALVGLDKSIGIAAYDPVTARVTGQSPTVWYSTIQIDKGTSSGVRVDQPVINGEGLVGKVTTATSNAAIVTLITDQRSGVSSKVLVTDTRGSLQPKVSDPDDLLLNFVAGKGRSKLQKGLVVTTSGTVGGPLQSLFPPGIPIGTISRIDEEEVSLYQRVHVKPYADLRRLDFVQVLTRPQGGGAGADRSDTAQVP